CAREDYLGRRFFDSW
nr:immunoglobulin heavy chain junction region [Macaca mulatta]